MCCAVLWVWLMLPELWQTADGSQSAQRDISSIMYSWMMIWPLAAAANGAVLVFATRPMWRGTRPSLREETKRGGVLLLCLLFHVLTSAGALLLPLAVALAFD